MADSVETIVYDRLDADANLDDDAKLYVIAALDGTLDEVIEGGDDREPTPRPDTSETPAGAYLRRLSIAGFRGIGPHADLDVAPGPGLTLVVGANGTGKSSFAEGLEFLLTGQISRWQDKPAEWRQDWRNRHAQDPPELQASFTVDGQPEDAVVSRRWVSDGIEDHTVEGLAALEWTAALDTHRPFLSYDQLSNIVEKGPSARYDAMAAGLGLERLTEARERLRDRRQADLRTLGDARRELNGLLVELEALEDERARAVRAALANEPWDLDAIPRVLEGELDGAGERPLELLRRLAAIEFPTLEETKDLSDEIHSWVEEFDWDQLEGSNAARTARLTEVLRAAQRVHDHDGDQPCPVCEAGRLDDRWKNVTERRRKELQAETEFVNRMASELEGLLNSAQGLCVSTPDCLADAMQVGIDASALKTEWDRWSCSLVEDPGLPRLEKRAIPTWTEEHGWGIDVDSYGFTLHGSPFQFTSPLTKRGLVEVAGRLTERGERVRSQLASLHDQAQSELDRRENLWRPLSRRLLDWLRSGRRGKTAAPRIGPVQTAEKWLVSVEGDVRTERFRPIAERSQRHFEAMSKGSSVSLDSLTLSEQATSPHLEIGASIDGQAGAALGVMSQGELNVLSLSLFLARALLPESPFRFLVIDDPVQAMDANKIYGLAKVLSEVACERQVIVFTHDERLPETVRRLDIKAREMKISSRDKSSVECQLVNGPVQQYLSDARSVLLTTGLGDDMKWRVVAQNCRMALEAACVEAAWRKRAGTSFSDLIQTEKDIRDAPRLKQKLALALLGDAGREGEVLSKLNRHFRNRWAGDVVNACNTGMHNKPWKRGLRRLIRDTQKLAEDLPELER